MGRYAAKTKVSVERSRVEIEQCLARYGADSFMSGWDRATSQDAIEFTYKGLRIQFRVHRPENPQEQRQRWRALFIVIKAKLEAVDSEISTFEEEFLAWVVASNGRRIGEILVPQLEKLASRGAMPLLAKLSDPAPEVIDV